MAIPMTVSSASNVSTSQSDLGYLFVISLLVLLVASHLRKWIIRNSSNWTKRITSIRHLQPISRYVPALWSNLVDVLDLAEGLGWLTLAFVVLNFFVPTMREILLTYSGQILTFASVLITASSVLLAVANLTAVSVQMKNRASEASRDIRQRNEELTSSTTHARRMGMLTVILSILALLFNGLKHDVLKDYALTGAIIAFVLECYFVFRLGF
jgi:hypothetical protein